MIFIGFAGWSTCSENAKRMCNSKSGKGLGNDGTDFAARTCVRPSHFGFSILDSGLPAPHPPRAFPTLDSPSRAPHPPRSTRRPLRSTRHSPPVRCITSKRLRGTSSSRSSTDRMAHRHDRANRQIEHNGKMRQGERLKMLPPKSSQRSQLPSWQAIWAEVFPHGFPPFRISGLGPIPLNSH